MHAPIKILLKEDEYKHLKLRDKSGKQDSSMVGMSLAKAKGSQHGSSFNVFDERRDDKSPEPIRDISQKIKRMRDGKIDISKNLYDIEIDESSIYRVFTNDDQSVGVIRINETPTLSKQTSHIGNIIVPTDLSINIKNMTSATTNDTLFKPNHKSISPQKNQGQKGNANMMIKNITFDHNDEPIDFDKDLEARSDEFEYYDEEDDEETNGNELG